MTDSILSKRLVRVRERLENWEEPGFLVSSPANITYLTNFTGSTGKLLISPERAWLLSDFRYRTQAAEELSDEVTFVECGKFFERLKELLSEAGTSNLLFESCHFSYADFQKLSGAIEGVNENTISLHAQEALVEQLRVRKDSHERGLIKQAISIAEAAFEKVLPLIKPGAGESEIALLLEYEMKKGGALKPSFDTIVASGRNGAKPHAGATDKKLAEGDLVVIDWGAVYRGYCSDMTRTVCLGEPGRQGKEILQITRNAQAEAIKNIRSGVTCAQVDASARNLIKDRGYGDFFGHGTGHGVGLEVHEKPTVSSQSQTVLEPGTVFTVEPGIYLADYGGVRIEDMVAVTEDGCEVLTSLPKEIIV